MWQKIKPYVVSLLISLGVGGLSALLTQNSMDFYETIQLPPLAPPGWLFPIVWALLYILMGISAALVWINRNENIEAARRGIKRYGASLVVNFLWSIIFFNLREFLFAFVWLLLLLFLIGRTICYFKKVYPAAAYLQIPYFLWVTFAGYLNFAIYLLNR